MSSVPPTDPPHVSVVVTHYQQPRELELTLAALARQSHPAARLEVIVADDGSSSRPAVPAGMKSVTQEDRGFRAARIRNRAVSLAEGDVLLFLDADTVPEPGYVAALSRLPAQQREAVVVGRRRHADLSELAPGADVAAEGARRLLDEPGWLRDAYTATDDLRRSDETSFRFVVGAVMGCSRWFFEQTGGFEEAFTSYGGEDWEWAHRAWTHGALLGHVPAAVAWHDGPSREDRPGWGSSDLGRERMLAETLAIASWIPVPGTAPAGLLGPAGDPAVTVDASVEGDQLVLCIDSVLQAFPRARVLLDAERAALFSSDPRVVEQSEDLATDPAARSSWRHLHLLLPVTGTVDSWQVGTDRLRGVDALDRLDLTVPAAGVAARWTTIRSARRSALGLAATAGSSDAVATGLTILDGDVTAQARWGGWR